MKKYSENFGKQRDAIYQMAKMARDKPVISVTSKDLPPIEKWKIGKTYKIYGSVELKSLRKTNSGMEGELEIISLSDEEPKEESEDNQD